MDKYEYIDHTADVIVHAWGDSLADSFANSVYAMFGFMADLSEIGEHESITIFADFEAPTEEHMLFKVLDECLFTFMTQDYFIIKRISFDRLDGGGVEATAFGEKMDIARHSRGTEIKAVTMHGMSVEHSSARVDTRFLLDI